MPKFTVTDRAVRYEQAGILAFVSLDAALQVSEFLELMIHTHAPPRFAKEWQEVADALYAITNDTDAIVLKEGHLNGET